MGASYHLRPQQGWLNDPNGMLRRDGRWHVFYQHNPAAPLHGDIHWGHASSDDLVTWTDHPVAFGPTSGAPDAAGCWSGVALDLGARVAAVYTACEVSARTTSVCVRYAADPALDDWSAPVVVAHQDDVPASERVREMRDPFLFTSGGRRWALLGAGLGEPGTEPAQWSPALLLWSCDDLEAWTYEGVWLDTSDPVLGAPTARPAHIWECPQLVDVDGLTVLLVSLWLDDELTGVAQAVGELVVADDGRPRLALRTAEPLDAGTVDAGTFDAGTACYAPQVAVDDDGPWAIGWVVQRVSPGEEPADGVAGCLTLSRRARRDGGHVWWEADPRTESLVGRGVAAVDGSFRGGLPTAARVVVQADAVVSRGGLAVEVVAGSTVWVDDAVLEVYLPRGVPSTHRATDAGPWVLA